MTNCHFGFGRIRYSFASPHVEMIDLKIFSGFSSFSEANTLVWPHQSHQQQVLQIDEDRFPLTQFEQYGHGWPMIPTAGRSQSYTTRPACQLRLPVRS